MRKPVDNDDLYGRIATWKAPPGDQLPFLLTDPRQVRTTHENDGLWVRILDVAASLSARRYPVHGELVLEVVDDVWGRGGTYRLNVSGGTGSCESTDGAPDIVVGIAALGSVYLGAHRFTTLTAAGLCAERTPGTLALADALFASERPPLYGTHF